MLKFTVRCSFFNKFSASFYTLYSLVVVLPDRFRVMKELRGDPTVGPRP